MYLCFLLLLVLFFKSWLQFGLELSLVRRRFPWAAPRCWQIQAKFCWDFFLSSSSFLSPGEDDLSWPSSCSVFKKQAFNTEKQMYLFREQKQIMTWQKTVLHTQNFRPIICIYIECNFHVLIWCFIILKLISEFFSEEAAVQSADVKIPEHQTSATEMPTALSESSIAGCWRINGISRVCTGRRPPEHSISTLGSKVMIQMS